MNDGALLEEIPVAQTASASKSSAPPNFLLRFFPCLSDLAFLFPIAALYTFLEGARTLLGDGDTGWHIRTGDWILQHGQVPHRDIFSFTKPDNEWFAWEWGWDVLFSLIHRHWSLSGVVFANLLILGFVGVLLYRLVRRSAPNDTIAFLITAAALCASSLHWLARPHLLSWVFILTFLHLLDRVEQGNQRLLWWSPLLILLWVNLHGSFFIGLLFLLTFAVAHCFEDVILRGCSPLQAISRQRAYLGALLACLAASLINPYGWRLHEHVIRYLSDTRQLAGINEFISFDFHSPLAIPFELLLVLGVGAAYRLIRGGHWAQAVMILIWAHLGLQSVRNIPVFVFVAAPACAAFLKAGLETAQAALPPSLLTGAASAVISLGREFSSFERVERFPILPAVCMVFLGAGLGLLPRGSSRIEDFDKRDFPVAAATEIARRPDARVFTFEQWGDYLIYRFFPQRSAFVDGRSDFYGAEFGQAWRRTIKAKGDWNAELSRYSVDTVLLRTDSPLGAVLKQSNQWNPVYDDGTAVIFRKAIPLTSRPVTAHARIR